MPIDIGVEIQDLLRLRTRIRCQIVIELKTFSFAQNALLTGATDAPCAILRNVSTAAV